MSVTPESGRQNESPESEDALTNGDALSLSLCLPFDMETWEGMRSLRTRVPWKGLVVHALISRQNATTTHRLRVEVCLVGGWGGMGVGGDLISLFISVQEMRDYRVNKSKGVRR